METNKKTSLWVVGVIVVILVLFGSWLWSKQSNTSFTTEVETETEATSTTSINTLEKRSDMTVNEVVASLATGSAFKSYLTSTGVSAQTTGKGPFTVFVPENSAFSRLKPGTVSTLSSLEKKRLVQYHIVANRALDADAVSYGNITSLSRDILNFNASVGGVLQVNSSRILKSYRAKNGIVYLISEVLIPPAKI